MKWLTGRPRPLPFHPAGRTPRQAGRGEIEGTAKTSAPAGSRCTDSAHLGLFLRRPGQLLHKERERCDLTTPTATKPADPLTLLRTRRYVVLLVLAAILGVPIAAIAYGFLKLVGVITPDQIPGVFLAALAMLALGAVLGPEAPLIALGGGLAVLAVRFRQRDMPAQTLAVVGAAGSFAAIATLFGSPLPAAFLLMEAAAASHAELGAAPTAGAGHSLAWTPRSGA